MKWIEVRDKLPEPIAVLILALLVMAFGWLRSCEKAKELVQVAEDGQLREDTARLGSSVRDSTARLNELRFERASERLEFEALKTRLNQSVTFWKGKAKQDRPQVIVLADSIPVLKGFLEATDSVIAKQDSVIEIQSLHLSSQAKLYELEIATMAGRHIKQQELTEVWKSAAIEREKDLKKERRSKRFFRGLALVLGATTAVLILAN
jgi:hypothetical protein